MLTFLAPTVKNTYLLVDYGDYTANEDKNLSPYVQLLSTTNDTAVMHQEFVSVRLGGVDTTSGQKILQSTHAPASSGNQSTWDKIKKWVIIGASVAGALLLLGIGLCVFCMRRRGTRGQGQRYQQLGAPAPAAASDMHLRENAPHAAMAAYEVEEYQPQYQSADYQPQYQAATNPYQTAGHHSQLAFQSPPTQYQTPYDPHH